MPEHVLTADLADIRFVLFEHLPIPALLQRPAFAHVDREQIDMLIDEAYRFSREVLAPINHPGDREGCHFENGQVTTPKGYKNAWKQFKEGGWHAISLSQDAGGMGLPRPMTPTVGELTLGGACPIGMSAGLTLAAATLIHELAPPELRRIYLPKLVAGDWQGTMCITEPQAGTAVGDVRTVATPDGDGYLISGTKIFITCGDHDLTENHVHLVLARTPGAPKGVKGLSLFLVPKYLPTADGGIGAPNDVVCTGVEHKLGVKASPTCTMSFGGEGRCRGWLIGELGKGLRSMFHMMNEERMAVGMQSIGIAAAAYQYAAAYAAERLQGVELDKLSDPDAPRVPINRHPDVRRMLLTCKALVEASRALVYSSYLELDLAEQAEDPKERERRQGRVDFLTPLCKAWVSDVGFEVTHLAVQVMGGAGYVSDHPVEQHLRDQRITSIYEGTNGIQAMDLLGRKVAGKGGALYLAFARDLADFVAKAKQHLALADLVTAFAAELDRWNAATADLGARGMSDPSYSILQASPYLQMTGNLCGAWLLLSQAIIAHDQLQRLYLDRGAADPQARRALAADDARVRFYRNKVETARFFVHHLLPRNRGLAAEITSGDRSVFDYVP